MSFLWDANVRLARMVTQLTAERDYLLRENARLQRAEEMLDNIVTDSQQETPYRLDPWMQPRRLEGGNVLDFAKEATLERRLRLSVRRLG